MIAVTPWDGKPITTPGIYGGIDLDVYHSAMITDPEPSLSSTSLRAIWRHSAAAYWVHSIYNPNRIPDDPNRGMIVGRALHHVAQGGKFKEVFAIRPTEVNGQPWNGNRKDCIRWRHAQEDAGLTVVTQHEAESLICMARRLRENEFVKRGGLNGLVEASMFWRDSETGIWLRARPDVIPTESGNFCDLKKTVSALYPDLQGTVAKFGYHQQGALVMAGAQVLNIPSESFTLLFVESEPPYCVQDVTIDAFDIDRGMDQNRVAIRKFEHAWKAWTVAKRKTDFDWPGPQDDTGIGRMLSLPDWARLSIDRRLERELGKGMVA